MNAINASSRFHGMIAFISERNRSRRVVLPLFFQANTANVFCFPTRPSLVLLFQQYPTELRFPQDRPGGLVQRFLSHTMRRVLIVTAIFAAACASTVPRNSIDLSRAEVVDLTRESGVASRASGGQAESRIPNPESRARPHRSGDDRAAALHQIAMGANVPGLENIANLDRLPPRGAYVIALPMKIAGGSGGPLRGVAPQPSGSNGE